MNLIMQGMRRSGTTIIFDILSQDPRLDMYYEPFSLGKVGALGGGSGIQQVDLMQKIRDVRERFVEVCGRGEVNEDFNLGAPTAPKREFDRRLPGFARRYIRFVSEQSEHTVFKFTRAYCKVKALKKTLPDASFVLLTRHPQDVVTSYMYGKGGRHRSKFPDSDAFFTHFSKANPWNSFKLFRRIIRLEERRDLKNVPNWMRYLVIWKYTFDLAYREGERHFGDAFMLLRHEDLGEDPRGAVAALYEHIGLAPSEEALQWAERNVEVRHKECYAGDPRWLEAYDRVNLQESLETAGYGPAITGEVKT